MGQLVRSAVAACQAALARHGASIYARHDDEPLRKYIRLNLLAACRRRGTFRSESGREVEWWWLSATEQLIEPGADAELLRSLLSREALHRQLSHADWSPKIRERIDKMKPSFG